MGLLAQSSNRRRGRRRALHVAMAAAIVLLALPYILVVLYRFVNPVSTLMVWRWATGQKVEQSYVPLERMSSVLPLAVMAAEDARYCSHPGVDFRELKQIVEEADDLDDLRGGSTITQQTVKNLFLWHGRSYTRKVLEMPLALWTDLVLPKRRVLEIYLNIAEWGPSGQFGAEAAARRAFGKSARDLTPGQAGTLAAILPNPVRRDARQPRANVQRLAGVYAARAASSPWLGDCLRPRRTP